MHCFTFAVVGEPSPSSTTLVASHRPILIGGPCASIAVVPTSTRLHLQIERIVITSSGNFLRAARMPRPASQRALAGSRRLLLTVMIRRADGLAPRSQNLHAYNGCLPRAIEQVCSKIQTLRFPCPSSSSNAPSPRSATSRPKSLRSSATSPTPPCNRSAAACSGSSPSSPKTKSSPSLPHPTWPRSGNTPGSPTSPPTTSTSSSSSPTSPPANNVLTRRLFRTTIAAFPGLRNSYLLKAREHPCSEIR